MSFEVHKPIMVQEILEHARQLSHEPSLILDGTFGRGGHTREFLKNFKNATVYGIDKDQTAIEHGKKYFADEITSKRLVLTHSDFKEFAKTSRESWADIILLDLGVSSPQLDNSERGFSFLQDGPLDMRMDQRQELTAAKVINEFEPEELIKIFREYGEVKSPGRVVRAIVMDRQLQPFQSTKQLAEMIARVEGWKKKGIHPATLYFMAIRILVNHELEGLDEAIASFQAFLKPGGRLLVMSFHSLEDRVVKQQFLSSSLGGPVHRKVIVASEEEQKDNPRSRSAKLRVFERGLSAIKQKKNKYADKRGLH